MSEPRLKTSKEADMGLINYGANEFSVEELEEMFNEEFEQDATPPATEDATPQTVTENTTVDAGTSNTQINNDVTTTKAFAKRLRESTDKARREEREAIAKALGYESYDSMLKKKEQDVITDKGYDATELSPIIDEIVKNRLENDPRMQELAELKSKQVKEFGKRELAEISELTNGEITSLEQLPREVLESWKTEGSLVSAYMKHEGGKLVRKIKSEQGKGTTAHLSTPGGTTPQETTKRPLTAHERNQWKFFNPGMSDEELDKIRVDN